MELQFPTTRYQCLIVIPSDCKALQAIYPDYMPTAKPRSMRDQQSQKEFFDQLAIKWNIRTFEDWNRVTFKIVVKEGGNFIERYNNSVQRGTLLF